MFSFSNQQGTISGYIRWLPKFVLKNVDNADDVKSIDNFQTPESLEVIPLTPKLFQKLQKMTESSAHTIEFSSRQRKFFSCIVVAVLLLLRFNLARIFHCRIQLIQDALSLHGLTSIRALTITAAAAFGKQGRL